MPHEVIMPALGMAQDTGLLVSWLKLPGDAITKGEALMEVETDKTVMEVEAQASGFLTSVVAAAGDHVPVGQVVAVISETADAPTTPLQQPTSTGTDKEHALPEGTEIIMPALGMAQDTGLIVTWHKQPGEPVAFDDILLEVETDKSTMEVEAGYNGFVAALLAEAQQTVPVGSVIAVITKDKPEKTISRGTTAPPVTTVADESKPVSPVAKMNWQEPINEINAVISQDGARILASPKTRRLALEQGFDLTLLARHGVPQPYHVADLATLKTLGPSIANNATSGDLPAAHQPATLHIKARVPTKAIDALIDRMATDGDIQLEPRSVWLRFARSEEHTSELQSH